MVKELNRRNRRKGNQKKPMRPKRSAKKGGKIKMKKLKTKCETRDSHGKRGDRITDNRAGSGEFVTDQQKLNIFS